MKKIIYIILITTIISLFFSCDRYQKVWYDNLSRAEKKEFTSGDIPEERIENLKEGINYYQKDVKRTIKDSKQIGIYFRMLALEYMSLEMYNEALKNLEFAIEYFPTNPLLFYKAAVSSGQMSLTISDQVKKKSYLEKAEFFYKRALVLDPDYKEVLYGLSILYIFELDKTLEAEPLLEKLVKISKKNFDAYFLLARVKITKGEVDSAADIYSYIESNSKDNAVKEKALENRMQILGSS